MGVNIKDIAKEIGVAPSTISKALNNRTGVNNVLKAKIKKAADRLGYAPYMAARETGMYDTKLKTIAVIYPRVSQYIIEHIQKGTDKVFTKKGYYELRYTIDVASSLINEEVENELLFKRLLTDKRISGILFGFIHVSDVLLAQFHKNNIYTVLLNNYTHYGKCVTINNFKAMYQIVLELIKLGHKNIGLIMPSEESEQVWKDRYNGYKKGLEYHKIPYNPNFIIHEYTFKIKSSAYATKQLLHDHPEINAIIYGSDIQAYGGLKILKEINRKVPDDIVIVGFDDTELNHIMEPSLSSVNQPIEKMGEIGANMLINAIKNKDLTHEAVELEAALNLRGSCIKGYKDPFWH